jgi:hypothetical protein
VLSVGPGDRRSLDTTYSLVQANGRPPSFRQPASSILQMISRSPLSAEAPFLTQNVTGQRTSRRNITNLSLPAGHYAPGITDGIDRWMGSIAMALLPEPARKPLSPPGALCFPGLTRKMCEQLLVGPGERMAAQFPAKRIADLGDNFDLGRVIELRILELMHRVLVIDRVRWEMDQVGGIAAE